MTDLFVPFAEKGLARAQGARWNPTKKVWFAPPGADLTNFQQWISPAGTVPAQYAPAAKNITEKLFVDLVPSSAWFSNLRSELLPSEWNAVRKSTYEASNHLCSACGGRGSSHPVECHERWAYDEKTQMQTLLRLCSLCPACHEASHMGFANVRGRGQEARQHLSMVNKWTQRETEAHVDTAFDTFVRRSAMKWTLDARVLLKLFPMSVETSEKILEHAAGRGRR